MKIVFHERYYNSDYAMDPAAATGRLDAIIEMVKAEPGMYDIISPDPAGEADILRAHGQRQYERVKQDSLLYELAALAAGGAVKAACEAYDGNPAFAVIRPPGHHASADSCWGFCYFNNMAISLLRLYSEQKIKKAFILDFDLHTGDGNINILSHCKRGLEVSILNPVSGQRRSYLEEVEAYMKELADVDIFAACAGFDQGIDDWGGLLYPEDYTELGRLMKVYANKLCKGRRYAILEGGYNHDAIGLNADAFCRGFA